MISKDDFAYYFAWKRVIEELEENKKDDNDQDTVSWIHLESWSLVIFYVVMLMGGSMKYNLTILICIQTLDSRGPKTLSHKSCSNHFRTISLLSILFTITIHTFVENRHGQIKRFDDDDFGRKNQARANQTLKNQARGLSRRLSVVTNLSAASSGTRSSTNGITKII